MSSLSVSATDQISLPLVSGEGTQAAARLQSTELSFAEAFAQANANLARNSAPGQSPGRLNRWQSLRYLMTGTRLALPSFLLGLSQLQPLASRTSDQPQSQSFRGERQVGGGVLPVPLSLPQGLGPGQAGHKTGWQSDWEIASPKAPATTEPGSIFGMAPTLTLDLSRPLELSEYPQPANNNGRGIHWIPTTGSSPAVVDRFVAEAQRMGIRWVTFLNQGTQIGANDYLVKRLVEAGIMPVLRVYTDGGAPIQGDLGALVRHYRSLGVHYFQLYNEPNLRVENGGAMPDVGRYLDLWLPAARTVVANGGLPGFGALSPQGDVDDLTFLREALQQIKARGATDVLNRSWLSVHNYGSDYLRVRQYNRILRQELGRSLPQISTEAGIYPGPQLNEQEQVRILAEAYRYMKQREPYYLAYTYWIIANALGEGHDPAWEQQALFRADGSMSPLVQILQTEA